jgi:hypothetical protein
MKRLPIGSLFAIIFVQKSAKMKSAKQLFVIICLFIGGLESINAQLEIGGTDILLDKLRLNKGLEGGEGTLYQDIKGDPYVFGDFQKGVLYVLPDQKFDVEIRYDIYADQMHLKSKDQIYAIIHPEKVKLIDAGNLKFIYSPYLKSPTDKEPEMSSYFLVRTEGKCMLLVKKNIRVQDAEPPKLYQEAKPAKFVPQADTYFLKMEGKSAVKIKSKKELLTVMNDRSDAIDSYMSSNKLDVKDINDLEKIVIYYNGK